MRPNSCRAGIRSWLGAGAFCALALVCARAQEARWVQLMQQVQQLHGQGNNNAALPLAQQAVQVAQTTWGAQDLHAGLALNALGIVEMDLEKFGDAETALKQAVTILTNTQGAASKNAASALDNLGVLYQEQANYPAAEKITLQALAIHEKLLGPNDEMVATDSNNLALIYMKESKYADSETYYKKAIAIDQKLGRADLSVDLGGLGSLYGEMHKYADAEQVFGQALALDLKALGPQSPAVGLDLYHLATAYQFGGKYVEAEQTYGKAMAVEQKASTPDQATIALTEQNMGALYRDEGRYPESESMLLLALKSRAQVLGPNHPDVAEVLRDLGSLYQYEMRYSDAERAYRLAVQGLTRSVGPTDLLTAEAMVDLAQLYGSHGQWGMADQLYHNAIPIYLKVLGETNERVALLIFRSSDELLTEQKFDNATSGFVAAEGIYQKVKGPASPEAAMCVDRLASIAEDGAKHDLAEKLHLQALGILEKADGADSLQLTDSLEGLGRVYKNEQRYPEAEKMYLRHLKIEQAHLKPDDPELRNGEADMAGLYFAWDKPAQAEPYFKSYLGNLMDEFRANAATMSERDRLIYFAGFRNAFPLFYSFVLKYHDQIPELAGEMYDDLLQEKGLTADSAAAMRAAVLASGDQQAVAMLDKLASDKSQLAALKESTGANAANHAEQVSQLAIEANTLEQSLMRRSAALSGQKAQNAATWRDVQKTLNPGDSAVEVIRFQYQNGAVQTSNQVYVALVVTPESKEPAFVVLGEADDLEAGPMLAYRGDVGQTRGLEAEETPVAPGKEGPVANTSAAYTAFWKPLEPALGNSKRVYFAADGVLDTIPIGLMSDSDGKMVMEKVQLRIVNSTKDLLLPARTGQAKNALLVGNPKFDLSAAQQKTAIGALRSGATGAGTNTQMAGTAQSAPATLQVASRGADLKGGDLNPLPGTQVEVDTVDKLLKNAGWQATEYTADLALKDAVTQAHSPRVVHIATHGFFLTDEELKASAEAEGKQANVDEDPMLRAGLFFAGADRVRTGAAPEAGVDDGVLTAYEASQLNLEGTELVVLSACETGLGKELNSDGVFGLRRGLQEAGAETVMMSMWSVPDKETQELMSLFYAKWLGGSEKPEALRQAQLEEREVVRKRYGKDLPFYWGAFVLIGK
jgi:CHAT domain-containing protein